MTNLLEQDRLFFSAINFQKLLGLSSDAADLLAMQNLSYIRQNDHRFQTRLQRMLADCKTAEPPLASTWLQLSGIEAVRQRLASPELWQGCLLALFHVGPHRDVLPDLASAGIPFSAPVAGQVYQDFYLQKHLAPANFADCFELLAVDDPRIGRQLLKRIKAGRYLAIYVDGNMGPDGHHCREGIEVVHFGNVKVRVKAGIARLASQFSLPVLPLFCQSEPAGPVVYTGELLPPPMSNPDASQQLMQQLYQQLFQWVAARPEQWEYAACLQRWLVTTDLASNAEQKTIQTPLNVYRLAAQQVRCYQQQQQHYLVHVGRGKAVVLPDFLHPELARLQTGFMVPSTASAQHQLQQLLEGGYLEQVQ